MSKSKNEKVFLSAIKEAYKISLDVGKQVEKMLEQGIKKPLDIDEERKLLRKTLIFIRKSAEEKEDRITMGNLEGDIDKIVDKIVNKTYEDYPHYKGDTKKMRKKKVELLSRNRIHPGPVKPTRRFHMREVALNFGYVKTKDIDLWEDNVRLDIHLGQFRNKFGRSPNSSELLDLMLSQSTLPSVGKEDEFEIKALAESIAINGVRVPPIIDTDGTLLDGNRRVTACYLILNSSEFDTEQKRKVEYLFVHQLTEHASDEDRDSVIVSLNFEDDHKKPWPEYVKARKVYDEWQAMLSTEPRRPNPDREREMKRELSAKFALGTRADKVNRYIKMVDWATSFEDYLTIDKGIEEFEVKHKANEKFQYFDELSKGSISEGGVAYTLDRDDKLKRIVFDLLFQDKIKNWSLIRDLRYVGLEDRDQLAKALDMPADEDTEDYVDKVLSDARMRSKESRVVGADQRIKTFVSWLEKLPIGSFGNPDEISITSLQKLLDALRLAEKVVKPAIEKRKK